MNKQEFETILEQAGTDLDTMVTNFSELTVEGFDALEDEMKDVFVGVFEHADDDLSETELGQMFAEDTDEDQEVVVNEDIVATALQGNIVETQELFNAALQERIADRMEGVRDEVRSSLFEEVEQPLTFAAVMEEEGYTLDQMIYVAENMSEDEFETLEEDDKAVVATFNRIFEGAEGDQEVLEAAIVQPLTAE
mgnify:FL=1